MKILVLVNGYGLVGREVLKLFGGQYYAGKVTEFHEEMGWYRVVAYEDGDSEDVEWHMSWKKCFVLPWISRCL